MSERDSTQTTSSTSQDENEPPTTPKSNGVDFYDSDYSLNSIDSPARTRDRPSLPEGLDPIPVPDPEETARNHVRNNRGTGVSVSDDRQRVTIYALQSTLPQGNGPSPIMLTEMPINDYLPRRQGYDGLREYVRGGPSGGSATRGGSTSSQSRSQNGGRPSDRSSGPAAGSAGQSSGAAREGRSAQRG